MSVLPGVPLGANTTSFSLEPLFGLFEGEITNPQLDPTVPPESYKVQLDVEVGIEWEEWQTIGTLSYPSLGMKAPLKVFYPMLCHEHFAGQNPSGQCYQVMEDFRDEKAVGYPEDLIFEMPDGTEFLYYGDFFAYGWITLSVQTDGSIFYSYLNGVLVVTNTYLRRCDKVLDISVGNAAFEKHPSNSILKHQTDIKSQLMPGAVETLPGQKLSGSFLLRKEGNYSGLSRPHAKQVAVPILPKKEPFEVEVKLPKACGIIMQILFPNDEDAILCGQIALDNNPLGTNDCGRDGPACGSSSFITSVICLPHFIGPNPALDAFGEVGQCWQFFTIIQHNGANHTMDVVWQHLSLQSDGSIYWSHQSGMLGTSDAILRI